MCISIHVGDIHVNGYLVLQVWSRELVEIEKLKVTTKFEIAYEQAPYYVDLVGSQSGRWQSRTKKETSKRKLMPNHFISA